jgi:phage terminase large subunit GpA-like protein
MFVVFELRENVVAGLPNGDMIQNKWAIDLLPAIKASEFVKHLPKSGAGSRGGAVKDLILFEHGVGIKWMTGGGGDKARSAFTTKNLIVTEVDGMDSRADTSKEADKISQMEGRLSAHGWQDIKVFLEGTVTTEEGRTWVEYMAGTRSHMANRCQLCGEYVTLGREDLKGWKDAENVIQARDNAYFQCPQCLKPWSEDNRRQACMEAVLLHGGQTVDKKGNIKGDMPETDTFTFRTTAADNLLLTAADFGIREYKASNESDEENAERKMRQFVWALPYVGDAVEAAGVSYDQVMKRGTNPGRGIAPKGTDFITVDVDVHKYNVHWGAYAWTGYNDGGQLIQYGVTDVLTDEHGFEGALKIALNEVAGRSNDGWPVQGGQRMSACMGLVDAGYETDIVYSWTRTRENWFPFMGFGFSRISKGGYTHPKKRGPIVKWIGAMCHLAKHKAQGVYVLHSDVDFYKTRFFNLLTTPTEKDGALTIYKGDKNEHQILARHYTAEYCVEEYLQQQERIVKKWKQRGKANHFLDVGHMALVAREFAMARYGKG